MLGRFCASRFILTVGVVNALCIGSALAFQHSFPSENRVIQENNALIKPIKNSWSRGGGQHGVANNQKLDTTKITKKGTWFRGGVLHNDAAKERAFVNK